MNKNIALFIGVNILIIMPKRKAMSSAFYESRSKALRGLVKKFKKKSTVSKLKKDVKSLKKAQGATVAVLNRERDPTPLTKGLANYTHLLGGAGGTSADIRHFFQMAAGDTDGARQGNKILALNFDWRGALECTEFGTTLVRIIITEAQEITGPAAYDILQYYVDDANNPLKVVHSSYARTPQTKFKVLYDQVHKLTKNTTDANGSIVKPVRIYHKFPKGGRAMSYPSSVNASPNIGLVQLWAVYAPTGPARSGSDIPHISWQCRERFSP